MFWPLETRLAISVWVRTTRLNPTRMKIRQNPWVQMDLPKCFHNKKLRRLWFTLASHFGVASTLQRHIRHLHILDTVKLQHWQDGMLDFSIVFKRLHFTCVQHFFWKMQFLYTKLTLYIFWKNLCHFFCQFFSLFEGRGRGRQHIYARLGTGCRDLQCCHQLCGEGKDTADAFAFELRLLGFVGGWRNVIKQVQTPRTPRFFYEWLQSIFWFLLLWRVHWHEIRMNCDELDSGFPSNRMSN